MANAGIILQARVGSTRLPGKVLKPLCGKPMIQWIVERLKRARIPEVLILATSNLEQDRPLVEIAKQMNIPAFQGSESDVLDRYYQCARQFNLQHIVRATGDNPFVDPEECDRLIGYYFDKKLDHAIISTSPEDGFPLGVGLEIFSYSALEKSWREGHAAHHREHVDEYILENPEMFRQEKMPAPPEKRAPSVSLTVDTPEQFSQAECAYKEFLRLNPGGDVNVPWLIEYYEINQKGRS